MNAESNAEPNTESRPGNAPPAPAPQAPASHDFDVQKEIHRQIRNDPDYDDWEYGTEPLPHEAWVSPEEGGKPAD